MGYLLFWQARRRLARRERDRQTHTQTDCEVATLTWPEWKRVPSILHIFFRASNLTWNRQWQHATGASNEQPGMRQPQCRIFRKFQLIVFACGLFTALMMEAVRTSDTSVYLNETTRRYIQESFPLLECHRVHFTVIITGTMNLFLTLKLFFFFVEWRGSNVTDY
jgi:hypothetical protein